VTGARNKGEKSVSVFDFLEKNAIALTEVNAMAFFSLKVLTISNAAAAKL
jgi:hypothetical protein